MHDVRGLDGVGVRAPPRARPPPAAAPPREPRLRRAARAPLPRDSTRDTRVTHATPRAPTRVGPRDDRTAARGSTTRYTRAARRSHGIIPTIPGTARLFKSTIY